MADARYLSPAQDAEFDGYIREWQAILNLQDWRIERSAGRSAGAMSNVKVSYGARLGTYKTGNWGSEEPTPKSLRQTALHEVLHVFVAELLHLTQNSAAADVLESAEHRVVNTLEKLLGSK